MNETLFFLDLEETIIESWDNPHLINGRKIQSFLKQKQITEIQIFSFAIRHDADAEQFNQVMRDRIERLLEVKITKVFTVEEVCLIIRKTFGAFWEPFEIPLVWGKARSFVDVCNAIAPKGSTCVLIDDMVEDVSIKNFTRDIFIRTININDLENHLIGGVVDEI